MVPPDPLLRAIATIAVVTIAAVLKFWWSGTIRDLLDKRRTADHAHASIPEIQSTLDDVASDVSETKDRVEDVDEKVEGVAHTMAIIHKDDDDVALDELRDRLDVETLDDDLLTD